MWCVCRKSMRLWSGRREIERKKETSSNDWGWNEWKKDESQRKTWMWCWRNRKSPDCWVAKKQKQQKRQKKDKVWCFWWRSSRKRWRNSVLDTGFASWKHPAVEEAQVFPDSGACVDFWLGNTSAQAQLHINLNVIQLTSNDKSV